MAEHTPGPWEYWSTRSKRIWVIAQQTTGPVICETRTSEADARLIAAAPELLSALQALIDLPVDSEDGGIVFNAALAAITKATGRGQMEQWKASIDALRENGHG